VHACEEQGLPLKEEVDSHMVFAMLVHESVDVGIKETIFARPPQNMDWRWWLEGIADYCAHQACRKCQPGAFAFARKGYLEKLRFFSSPSIDLLAEMTWFPKGYKDPGDVNHAYAASQYVISRAGPAARRGLDRQGASPVPAGAVGEGFRSGLHGPSSSRSPARTQAGW